MTDFPRGWTFGIAAAAGSTASITVPATAGVVHVLDSLAATLVSIAAAAAAAVLYVTVNIGSGANSLAVLAINGGNVSSDSAGLSGLDLATSPGGALVVTFSSVAPASYNQLLVIQGHDI